MSDIGLFRVHVKYGLDTSGYGSGMVSFGHELVQPVFEVVRRCSRDYFLGESVPMRHNPV